MAMLDTFGDVSTAAAYVASLSPARLAVSPGLTPTQTPTTAVLLAGEQVQNVQAARQVQVVSNPAFESWAPRRLNPHKATFSTSSTASTASTASLESSTSHNSTSSFSSLSSSASSSCSSNESLLALRTLCFDGLKPSDSCPPASYSSPTSSFGQSFAGPNQRAKGPPQPLNLQHSTFESPKRLNLDQNQKHLDSQQNRQKPTATPSIKHTVVSRLEPSLCVSAGVSSLSVSLQQLSPQTALHARAKATASPSSASKPSHSPRGPEGYRARARTVSSNGSTSTNYATDSSTTAATTNTRPRARSVSPYIQQQNKQTEGARGFAPSSSVLTFAGASSSSLSSSLSSLPQKARSPQSATAVPRTPQLLLFPPQRYSQPPRSAGFNNNSMSMNIMSANRSSIGGGSSTRNRSATVPSRPGSGFNVATSIATKTISAAATATATTPAVPTSIPATTENTTNTVAPSTSATVLSVAIPSPLLSPPFGSFPDQPVSARARLISGVPSPCAIIQEGATSALRPPRSADFLRSKPLSDFDSSLSTNTTSTSLTTGQAAYNRNPSPQSPSLPLQKSPALCSLSTSVSISTLASASAPTLTASSASVSSRLSSSPTPPPFVPALTTNSSANAQTQESSMTRPKTHAHHYKSQSESQSQSRPSANPVVHVSQHDTAALPASSIYFPSSAASTSLPFALSSTSSAARSHIRTRPRAPSDVSGYSSVSSSLYTKSLNSRALLLFPPQPLSAKTSAEFSRLQPNSLHSAAGPWPCETLVESTPTPAQPSSLAETTLNWSHYRSDNMPVNELIDEVDRAFASPTTAPKSAPLYRPATPPAQVPTQPPEMLEATQPFPPTAPLLPLPPKKHNQTSRQIIKMKPRRKKHSPAAGSGKASRWTITDEMMQRFRRVEAQEILTEDRLQKLKQTREREADEGRRKAEKAKKAQALAAARKIAASLEKQKETKKSSSSSSLSSLIPPIDQNKSLPPIPEVTLTAPSAVPPPMSHSPSSSISSAASVSTTSSSASTQPLEAAAPPASDEESAEYAPEEDEEYIYFHAAPTSITAPPFKHGRIRISKAESGIRLPGENALDWTAFQMAILGAGDYYSTPHDNILSPVSEVGDIEELADWLYGMNLPDCPVPAVAAPPAPAYKTTLKRHSSNVHGHHMYSYSALRKASESSIDDSASLSMSVSSSASQSSVDLPQTSARLFPLPPSPKPQPVRNTAAISAQDHWNKSANADRTTPATMRDSGIGMTQNQMSLAGAETEDSEYIPMGYNLGHDLGDFLRWEAQHVYAAAPY